MGSWRGKPDSLQSPKTKIQADNSPVTQGKNYRGDMKKKSNKKTATVSF